MKLAMILYSFDDWLFTKTSMALDSSFLDISLRVQILRLASARPYFLLTVEIT